MAGKIFINYRRGDDAGFTQALFQRLEEEFTTQDLFMDVEGHIKPGDDFVEVLNQQIAACDVLLAVIGLRWAELMAARAGDRNDFVTLEIKAALEQGKRVIPVLVGGAGMPHPDTLPEAIRQLARRNAVGLRPERFKADCQGLVTALKEQLVAGEQERAARTEAERAAAETARLEAEAQAAARAKAAEERGRAQAAAGLSAEEIRKAEELASWDFVKVRENIQDLRDHLARFPGGTTERYALAKLEGLLWAGLGSAPTIAQLQAYLDEFPKGANAGSAYARMAELERGAAEAKAAEERRAQETTEWGLVAASTERAKIEAFLDKWPKGEHAPAATTRLRELRQGKGTLRRGILLGAGATGALAAIGGGITIGLQPGNILWRQIFDQSIKTFSTPTVIRTVAIAPDRQRITGGGYDGILGVWDIDTGATGSFVLSGVGPRVPTLTSVAFSPDGKLILCGGDQSTLLLWDLATKSVARRFEGLGSTMERFGPEPVSIRSVAIAPDGKSIASASSDGLVKIWNAETGKLSRTLFPGHGGWATAVSISPDGRFVLSGGEDKTLRLWSLATGQLVHTLTGHGSWADALAFSPDGKIAVSGSGDHSLRLWDLVSGKPVWTASTDGSTPSSVSFLAGGKAILVGSFDRQLHIWDVASGKKRHSLTGHSDFVNAVAVASDGNFAVSSSSDRTLKLWDLTRVAGL